jgi:hypothetical protein
MEDPFAEFPRFFDWTGPRTALFGPILRVAAEIDPGPVLAKHPDQISSLETMLSGRRFMPILELRDTRVRA